VLGKFHVRTFYFMRSGTVGRIVSSPHVFIPSACSETDCLDLFVYTHLSQCTNTQTQTETQTYESFAIWSDADSMTHQIRSDSLKHTPCRDEGAVAFREKIHKLVCTWAAMLQACICEEKHKPLQHRCAVATAGSDVYEE